MKPKTDRSSRRDAARFLMTQPAYVGPSLTWESAKTRANEIIRKGNVK